MRWIGCDGIGKGSLRDAVVENERRMLVSEKKDFNVLELISIYHDEWKYRHECLSKRIIQFTVITFFTTMMPIVFGIFEGLSLPDVPLWIFPAAGIVMAILSWWFCLAEYSRIDLVNKKIKMLIETKLGFEYSKFGLKESGWAGLFNGRICILLPNVITVLQVLLAVFVIWLVHTGKLI